MNEGYRKYRAFPAKDLPDRTWPGRRLTKAPVWCSVDLRDGNQALVDPMDTERKLEFFRTLVKIGVKEIEVGYPSSSSTEYEFLRALIDGNLIPDDVTIQVLTQSREDLIARTFEALRGAKNVILHFYNNISVLQRKVVFHTDLAGVTDIAVTGAQIVKRLGEKAKSEGMNLRYEYSPESFMECEPDEAISVCTAVLDALGATEDNKAIINLPTTVECTMPNCFADLIEYFCRKLPGRERAVISVHPHNDRGTGVASAELAQLAGAERVEGTLFGNGERTGNVDMVTLALNLYTQGVDPMLDFSHINEVRDMYENATGMRVPGRQPYAGSLVLTAFSGSHQDAINKGLHWLQEEKYPYWHVPYLPIDPADLGRQYDPIVRINSQSGKGGAAFIMETKFGYVLPKAMHAQFGAIVQRETERVGAELDAEKIFQLFKAEYLDIDSPYSLKNHKFTEDYTGGNHKVSFSGTLYRGGDGFDIKGEGNGPIDAFFNAVNNMKISGFHFLSYSEHAISTGSDSQAVAYIQLRAPNGDHEFGVGMSHNIYLAPIRAIICAINRELRKNAK